MSNCIKELYDYELVKKCSKCGIISLKSNFQKKSISKNGLDNQCRLCWKQNYLDNRESKRQYCLNNRDRLKKYCLQNQDRIKEYQIKNHDKIIAQKKIYSNNKNKSDILFRLICKT